MSGNSETARLNIEHTKARSLQRYSNDPYLGEYQLRTLQTMALPTASITDDQLRNLAKECLEYREFFAKIKTWMPKDD